MLAAVNGFLVDAFGPLGPLIAIGALGLALIVIALPAMLGKERDRFAEIGEKAEAKERDPRTPRPGRLRKSDRAARKLQKYAHLLEPQDASELSAVQLKLVRAGYPGKGAVLLFHAMRMILAVGLLVLGVIYALIKSSAGDVPMQTLALYAILPGVVGYYLPQYWVTRRIQTRQTEIIQGFPDALDMMLVCVEAGQSLDQSIIRVAHESRAGYPALAEELELVSYEVKAGKDRVSVLKDMAERVDVPDVTSFVTTLIQSATFGTSIAESLRVYSADMRDKRVMRAEEKANMLPTKLTLGTMLFTVPPLLVILIGPSIFGIAKQMGEMSF